MKEEINHEIEKALKAMPKLLPNDIRLEKRLNVVYECLLSVQQIIRTKYKHNFSLRIGEVIHIGSIPCEYLGMGKFGTNTYPRK